MTGKTHIAIGTAAAAYLFPLIGVNISIPLIAGAALGSLLPDIEHPKSLINSKILPVKNKLVLMVLLVSLGVFILTGGFGQPNKLMKVISIFLILAGFSSHRTFTHSIFGFGVILYSCYLMDYYKDLSSLSMGIALGALLHIIADLFTHNGSALFYPFDKSRKRFPVTCTTGGLLDKALFAASTVLLIKVYI